MCTSQTKDEVGGGDLFKEEGVPRKSAVKSNMDSYRARAGEARNA
jgi:hypothetical protein